MLTISQVTKSLFGAGAFLLLCQTGASHAAVSQQPLMLVESVAPNMILTLDESGSMSWGHVPDNQPWNNSSWSTDSRRYRAANTNAMAYNPNVIYEIPPAFDNSGNEYNLSTSFTDAPVNGFLPNGTRGKIDLSEDYRVVREFRMPNGTFNRANHPDDLSCRLTGFDSNGTRSCTTDQAHFSITRSTNRWGTASCTATATLGGVQRDANCSFSRGTATASLSSSSGIPAYYYEYDSTLTGCTGNKTDTDGGGEECYRLRWVDVTSAYDENGQRLRHRDGSLVDGRQNFAIWYSFYKTRALATLSAASLAFYDLRSDVRLTWQNLATCSFSELSYSERNNLSTCNNRGLRSYSAEHKGAFYTWLRQIYFNTGTPTPNAMKRAGELLTKSEPWVNNPGGSGNTPENTYACRPSYHILMTDGMWNTNISSNPSSFRHDNTSFTVHDKAHNTNRTYNQIRPYYDDKDTTTLADLAMHYWATDLRPTLDDKVPAHIPYRTPGNSHAEFWDPRNNPATWQHMTNFIMGLGLSNALTKDDIPWEGGTHTGAGYKNLVNGDAEWPQTATSGPNFNNNVYDLWHAAINSRGEFFSVDSPEAMIRAFNDIINRIAERTATAAAAGAAPSTIENDPTQDLSFKATTKAYFPEYNSENWSGDVKQMLITRNQDGTHTRAPGWSAQSKIDAQANRNIYMANSSGATSLRAFSYSNLSNELKAIFDRDPDLSGSPTDNRGAKRVSYLTGDRTNEGDADNQFRSRGSVLGDIVNSQPAVVGTPSYLPYLADRIDGSPGDYRTFQQRYTTTGDSPGRPELIYVGANDGMLHAISVADGTEAFAFIPSAVLPHMPKLTGQNYKGGGHRFFVDGSPVVRDVYIENDWRTVLIGTLRAGGKSLFALDITNPGADGSGIELLWEVTNETNGYENLGYSFPEPEIVRLHSGEWAVLQGNGYDSTEGIASLFIINIADGELIKEVIAENTSGANGLSSVRGADNNADGIVDYAYAGDLQGNLWRFDLSRAPTTNDRDPFSRSNQSGVSAIHYEVSYGGNPLYQARYSNDRVQPITAPPSLVRHPTRRGYLVIIGTGKYFETGDSSPDTGKANSVYAIWDRQTRAQSTTGGSPTLTRANLQQQRIVEEKNTSFEGGATVTRTLRYVTDTPIEWYLPNTTLAQEEHNSRVGTWGWYLDLEVGSTKRGEMMVQRMLARGDTLLFGTLTPNEDPCADGASYWTYGINSHTGARTQHPTFDFNQDGRHDSRDTDDGRVPSGFATSSPITITDSGLGLDIGGNVGVIFSDEPAGRDSWQTMPLQVDEE